MLASSALRRPSGLLAAPLVLAVSACDGDVGVDGPFGLGFDGGEDCVEADVSGVTPPSSWTAELWMRGDPANLERPRPLLEWKGVFTLGAGIGGDTVYAVGGAEGLTWGTTLLDGVLHHVAATFDGSKAALYVDGVQQAFADGDAAVAPTSLLRIGCDASAQVYDGLLDEVHFSGVVRYDGDFDRPVEPFQPDADSVLLFHFDEGEGEESIDAASGAVAGIYGPEWVPFDITEGK